MNAWPQVANLFYLWYINVNVFSLLYSFFYLDCIDIICAFSTLALVFKPTTKEKEKDVHCRCRLKQGEQVWRGKGVSVIAPLVWDRCGRVRACLIACVDVVIFVSRLSSSTRRGWTQRDWTLICGRLWTREWYMIVIMNSLNWPTFLYKYIKIYDCRVLITYRYFFYDYDYYYYY